MGKYFNISDTRPIISDIIKEKSENVDEFITRDNIIKYFLQHPKGKEIAKNGWEKKGAKNVKKYNTIEDFVGNIVDWFSADYDKNKKFLKNYFDQKVIDGKKAYKWDKVVTSAMRKQEVDNNENANDKKDIIHSNNKINLNQIFYGPPGTGKTYKTVEKAVKIIDPLEFKDIKNNRELLKIRFEELKANGQIEFVTFHQSFGYEEFVEGIRPVMEDDNNEIEYDIKPGVFKKICEKAIDNTDEKYVIIIDEINRGNISKIFGEIITLIETDKRKENDEELGIALPYSKDQFYIPNNLYIIGTMNTADRSIALLDTALRRRFHFKEIMPNSKLLENISIKNIDLKRLFEKINERIEYLYDRDHQIGHSYFLELKDNPEFSELKSIFKNKIIPLLQEYFYDDWEKIQIILNEHYRQLGKGNEVVKFDDEINKDRIIQSKQCIEKNIIGFDHNFIDDNKVIYRINPELNNLEPNAFRKIYE